MPYGIPWPRSESHRGVSSCSRLQPESEKKRELDSSGGNVVIYREEQFSERFTEDFLVIGGTGVHGVE